MSNVDDDGRSPAGGALRANPDEGGEGIRRQARQRLQTEGLEVGVRVLIELAEDRKQKGSTRGAAAKALLQTSSTVPEFSTEDLADMTPDQIRTLLAKAQRQLEARMRVVQGRVLEHQDEPKSATHTGEVRSAGSLFD